MLGISRLAEELLACQKGLAAWIWLLRQVERPDCIGTEFM